MLVLLLVECGRKHDGAVLVLVISMAVYTVVEAHLVSEYIGRNYLLLVLGAYWPMMLHMDHGDSIGILRHRLHK